MFAYRPLPAVAALAIAITPSVASAADNYRVQLEGAPPALKTQLSMTSTLMQEARAFPTAVAVRRAGRADATAMESALRAAGYYVGRVTFELTSPSEPQLSDDDRLNVLFTIDPGPSFTIDDHVIRFVDAPSTNPVQDDATDVEPGDDRPNTLTDLGIVIDPSTASTASGAAIANTQQRILMALWDQGYPTARPVSRRAEIVSSQDGRARAIYEFETGPRAFFGAIRTTGLENTQEDYLQKLKTWEVGEPVDKSKIIAYRDRLSATGIFSEIDVANGTPDETGAAPILISASERKRRTIGAGASFSTVEGPGGRLFFEYRNIFGRGERARADLSASLLEQNFSITFDKPFPTLPGSLFANIGFANETKDAFDARTITASIGVSKFWFDNRLETRAGLAAETSDLTSPEGTERTAFFSLPLAVVWDTEDSPLLLSHGVRASFSLTPYTGTDTFTQGEFNVRTRIHAGKNDRFTLAGRARLGGTVGSSFENLPINKRFFAGGGSSVRAFAFQAAGPLDENANPIGGRSVIEGAVEGRVKITQNIQAATFLDAASVASSALPDFGGDYLYGVGAGVRYITPVGPLRVDVATPLERRDSDRPWQLYISLGQAF